MRHRPRPLPPNRPIGRIALAFAVALAVALVPGPLAAHAARAADPASPGPYPIAVSREAWSDDSRQRQVPLRIVQPRQPGEGNAASAAVVAGRGSVGALPVVLFSHGLGGSREAGQAWGDHWASHGYLVIHLQHPGSDSSVWQGAPDRAAAVRGMRDAMSGEQFMARVADVKFVLDELSRRVKAADTVVGRADLSRIGMSGHSFGAVTTQALAGERFGPLAGRLGDPRIRAFAAFSPSGGRDTPASGAASRFADIRQPFLSLTGTLDTSIASQETAQSRQQPFERMPAPDKYLLVLDGADHGIFSGQSGLRQGRRARPGAGTPDAEAAAGRARGAIQATSLMFWNAYLRDDEGARGWLVGGGPERQLGTADVWRFKR